MYSPSRVIGHWVAVRRVPVPTLKPARPYSTFTVAPGTMLRVSHARDTASTARL